VNLLVNRQIVLIAIVFVLLISACSQAPEQASAPTLVPPAATVDTGEIAAAVLSEVQAELETQSAQQLAQEVGEPTPDEPEIDTTAIVESVVEELEAQIAEEEERMAINLGNEAMAAAVESLQTTLVDLYERTNPSVVFIIAPPVGSGSGFVFGEDGTIVTNNHVVDGGRSYEVVFAGGERRQAELIGQDVDSDLAVIQVDNLPEEVEPLPVGSSESVAVGQFVIAIGNPFGEQGSMSLGIVSGLGRSLQSQRETSAGSSYSLPQVIQTDAPINPGNSGGPLLNLDGEVIGVNSAIASRTGTNSGVGFSIPVDAVRRIAPVLIEDGEYNYPFMGAAFDDELSLDEQNAFGLSQSLGAYVVSITVGGPADEAGLIAANSSTGRGGDLIVTIDEQPINSFSDLNGYLVFNTAVGQSINIVALRDGELIEVELTLGARP